MRRPPPLAAVVALLAAAAMVAAAAVSTHGEAAAVELQVAADALVSSGDATRLSDAVSMYMAAIDADPDLASAWANMGVALLRSGRQDRALHALSRATELDGNDAAAWLNLGSALSYVPAAPSRDGTVC